MSSRLSLVTAVFAATACLPAWAQSTASEASAQAATPAAARYSPERLAAMRNALASQVTVHDALEGGKRRPTAAEAAALSPIAPAAATPRVVALRGGGQALRLDSSNIEYLIMDRGDDGKASIRHGAATSVVKAPVTRVEGLRHAQ